MDFSNVTSITIDGKEVKNITVNGKVVWEIQK